MSRLAAIILFVLAQSGAFEATRLDTKSLTPLPAPYGLVQGGTAVLDVSIGADRASEDIAIVGGTPQLAGYLQNAVEHWRFLRERPGERRFERLSVSALFRPATLFPIGDAVREVSGAPRPDFATLPPLPRRMVDPGYPPRSVAEGTVVLEALIDRDGRVAQIRVVEGVPSLTEAAVAGVRQWEFEPALGSGQPSEGLAVVVISFRRPLTTAPPIR